MRRPRPTLRDAASDHQVSLAVLDVRHDKWQGQRIKRRITVHETDNVARGGLQPSPARCTETLLLLAHNTSTVFSSQVGRPVG